MRFLTIINKTDRSLRIHIYLSLGAFSYSLESWCFVRDVILMHSSWSVVICFSRLHVLNVALFNPSWFVCNILVCRRSTACAFICQYHWGSSSSPSLWILSCMLDESIAQAPLHCCHRHLLYIVLIALLLPLLRGISPVYSTEYIQKYRSFEMFIKLPFQRVVIHLKSSLNEGVMPVSLLALRAVQKFSECTTFNVLAIPACRNLRLTWFLIRWDGNFVELLNIQKYAAIFFWGCAEYWW